MATDRYAGSFLRIGDSPKSHKAVVPSDTTLLDPIPVALYVGLGGTVVVDTLDGDTSISYSNFPTGQYLIGRFTKVKAATTATLIISVS